jgi:hypothetical protein
VVEPKAVALLLDLVAWASVELAWLAVREQKVVGGVSVRGWELILGSSSYSGYHTTCMSPARGHG